MGGGELVNGRGGMEGGNTELRIQGFREELSRSLTLAERLALEVGKESSVPHSVPFPLSMLILRVSLAPTGVFCK